MSIVEGNIGLDLVDVDGLWITTFLLHISSYNIFPARCVMSFIKSWSIYDVDPPGNQKKCFNNICINGRLKNMNLRTTITTPPCTPVYRYCNCQITLWLLLRRVSHKEASSILDDSRCCCSLVVLYALTVLKQHFYIVLEIWSRQI